MTVSFDRVPPVWTQTRFNSFLNDVETWINGGSAPANFVYPYSFIVKYSSPDYTVYNSQGVAVYGGASDLGTVDGASGLAVLQACIDACEAAGGGKIVLVGPNDFNVNGQLTIQGDNVFLEGFGGARVVDTSGGSDATIKIGTYNDDTTMRYHCGLTNLRVIRQAGNEGTGDILEINGLESGRFNNVWLYNGTGKALFLNQHCYYNVFNGLYVNSVPKGIHLYSPKATPIVNINHFFGGLVAIGHASASPNAEYGIKVEYSNLNNFYGFDVEPRADYNPSRPDGVIVYGAIGTLFDGIRVGENWYVNGFEVTGDSDKRSYQTTINHANLQFVYKGIYVDYATGTSLNAIRGADGISYSLVELTSNHEETLIGLLNHKTTVNYLVDGNPAETFYIDPKANTKRFIVTATTAANQTNKQIMYVGGGLLNKRIYIDNLTATLVSAPGAGETCAVNLTDGVTTMTFTISNAETTGETTTNNFEWVTPSKPLLLRYTTSASAAVSLLTVAIEYHEVWSNPS